ncbi:squalene synthase [Cytidiella melzeri]|nr:squalene synthase [Cytidiella melzeri]
MGAADMLLLLFTRPLEFRTLVQFWLWHDQRDVSHPSEHKHTLWNRPTMKRCWELLDRTSRSFSAVIKQLDGDLARVICLYYLVLRGLDTIEDDMTLPDEKKQQLLRSFHEHTLTDGWTFTESGPDESDRQLLVEYDNVVAELKTLPAESLQVIIDSTKKMEVGMADYAHQAHTTGKLYLEKTEEYDLYCHYVAGLVGEGLSGLFSATGYEHSFLATQLELSNSMGLFLQKTNIIRDYREDVDQHRFFWPREIWGDEKFGAAVGRPAFKEMKEMYLPENAKQAEYVQSAMVLNALCHAPDALDYLRLLRDQSVFNFCAIPQTMAIATLNLCFKNPALFQKNIKIRKAEAADLIMRSKNPRDVSLIFLEYARKIHSRCTPDDPSFIKIAVICGRIEKWCEDQYPSFLTIGAPGNFDLSDPRSAVAQRDDERIRTMNLQRKQKELLAANADVVKAAQDIRRKEEEGNWSPGTYVAIAFTIVFATGIGALYLILWIVDNVDYLK